MVLVMVMVMDNIIQPYDFKGIGNGYGDVDGDGYGAEFGCGFGYGDGFGDGFGDEYGHGYMFGNEHVWGYRYECRYGVEDV